MKIRSLPAQLLAGLLLAATALSLTACGNIIYREPASNYAGRPIPPSGLLQRVMAAYTANGSQGGLEILDGLRDLRSNVQNTIPSFSIKGFSSAEPISIINLPEETTGYVLSYTDGSLVDVNYSTEASVGAAATFAPDVPSVAAAVDGSRFAGAVEQEGALFVSYNGSSIPLNLPNVDKVVINRGNTVILAMVRNSNQLYRVVKLPASSTPSATLPAGYIDCEPLLLPIYCVVPVGNPTTVGTPVTPIADRPVDAYFSLDGNTAYILNCGPECGGTTAGVTALQEAALVVTNFSTPYTAGATSPLQTLTAGTPNPIPIPGGVTAAISDGNYLYLAGQQLQSSGLLAGELTLLSLPGSAVTTDTPYTITHTYPISDGTHTKMLFADNQTLWIGSQQCVGGQRAANLANGIKDQSANENCLTRFAVPSATAATPNPILLSWVAGQAYGPGNTITDGVNVQVVLTGGTSGKTAPTTWNTAIDQPTIDGGVVWVNVGPVSPVQIIPIVTPNNPTNTTISAANPINTNIGVPYLNTNLNPYYYGNLTGLCWVQNYLKVYTAYGGQIHAFNTTDGSEINNFNITVQGTVLDVAYMDAETDEAN